VKEKWEKKYRERKYPERERERFGGIDMFTKFWGAGCASPTAVSMCPSLVSDRGSCYSPQAEFLLL
jgi:hypothetical protein